MVNSFRKKVRLDKKVRLIQNVGMIEYITKISTKGQMVIPKAVRNELKIDKNSIIKVYFDIETSKVTIEVIKDPIKSLRGLWKNKQLHTSDKIKKEMIEIEKETGNYE